MVIRVCVYTYVCMYTYESAKAVVAHPPRVLVFFALQCLYVCIYIYIYI